MELFVVIDRSIMGRGVFGVFSTPELATAFRETLTDGDRNLTEVRALGVTGTCGQSTCFYAAHNYDDIYDVHVFDGMYATFAIARDAAGPKGMIVEFIIDVPETRRIIQAYEPGQPAD